MAIRIVLAEDHYLVREGVRRLLEAQPEFEIAAVCGDLGSLLEAADRERPDVVVTDIRMPPGHADEGIEAARRLRESQPDLGVVVLSQYANPSYALALLDTGSNGRAYLLKERVHDLDQLATAIRTVAEGGSLIDPKVVEGLVADRARAAASPVNELTAREREVLRLIARGYRYKEIAATLHLSVKTVETHVSNVLRKLQLSSRHELTRWAAERRMI